MKIYVRINNETKRPFSVEQIKQMLFVGQVTPAHKAFVDKQTGWIPLSQVLKLQNSYLPSEPNKSNRWWKRKVGFPLGLGILVLPLVFSWFTLRPGYSKFSKFISFTWFGLILFSLIIHTSQINSPYPPNSRKAAVFEGNDISSITWQEVDSIRTYAVE